MHWIGADEINQPILQNQPTNQHTKKPKLANKQTHKPVTD